MSKTSRPSITTGAFLPRPRLEARLDEAFGRRLTTLVAGAGYGKTTLLGQWSRDVECAWYTATPEDKRLATFARGFVAAVHSLGVRVATDGGAVLAAPDDAMRADALAALLAAELELSLAHDVVVIVDDVHELAASPSARLLERFVRQAPPQLHLVVSGRFEPPFRVQRLRGQGQVLDLDAADLAFDADELDALLAVSLDEGARALAPRLYEVTSGWPATVRLAIDVLDRVGPDERVAALDALQRPEGPLFAYLAEEVFEHEPESVRELIRRVAHFERFSPELCEAIGITESRAAIEVLRRKGLFLAPQAASGEYLALHALVREFALERLPLDADEQGALHRRAAAWLEKRGELEAAFAACVESRDRRALAPMLERRGEELVSRGFIEPVIRAGESLLEEGRTPRIEEIVGEAHSLLGQWDEALACYRRAAKGEDELPPGLAWRLGRLYWDRGLLFEAMTEYRKGRIDGSRPLEEAFLLAWMSMPEWNFGNVAEARRLAEESLRAAERSGSSRAVAAAHNALAVSYLGHDHALFQRHNAAAREAAEAAGDLLQLVRSAITEAGPAEPREALEILEEPIRRAELSGAGLYLAGLLNSRGAKLFALERLDAATADHRRCLALFERYGSSRRAWSLANLGSLALQRGDLASARALLAEGLETSFGDAQGKIDTQRWLAAAVAYEDPEQARRLADAALDEARRLGYKLGDALLGAGWVALARGDDALAAQLAREAAAETQRQQLRLEFAEALELQAMASSEADRALALLAEASGIWREVGNEVALARNELAVARLTNDRSRAERARRRLRAAGVRDQASGAAGLLACLPPDEPDPVRIRTLGSFTVLRDGQLVALGAWRSRKARDLLKVLIARRGRAAPRELLMEALWPGEDPSKLPNRLSVALSNLRSVLDPERRFEPDYFVVGGKAGVSLRAENLPVDVEEFLADAEAGHAFLRDGHEDDARERLLAAEAGYAGDFLEEDAYEEWAAGLREEARVAYVGVANALADLAVRRGELDEAARYYLRVHERDPYDEHAHLGLIRALAAAGHHGEARRSYTAYASRMDEIGVEAAPYPAPSRAQATL